MLIAKGKRFVPLFFLASAIAFSGNGLAAPPSQQPPPATDVSISDYTAFPPFLPRVVSPNILFVLDYSTSMVRPAYGICDNNLGGADCRTTFANPADDYTSSTTYAGYFDSGYHYTCTTGNSGKCTKLATAGADNWNGNWLNWLTMTQFDVLKKVVVGGDVTPSPETGNPGKVQSVLPLGNKFYKIVSDANCRANAPDAYCDTATPQSIPYAWREPSGSPLAEWTGDRDAETGLLVTTLPFAFRLFDTDYAEGSSITIGVDGTIRFGNLATYPTDGDIPSVQPADTIAPYWDDAAMSGAKNSKVKTFLLGAAPNRTYVVSFENMLNDADTGKANPMTYQVLFFEAGSQIVFQYKEVWSLFPSPTFGAGKEATIGVQKANDTTKYKRRKNRDVSTNSVANQSAYLMTPQAKVFDVTPGNLTSFNARGSSDAFNVGIDVINTAKVSNQCPAGYYINKFRDACYDHVTEGLLQEFRDGELAGLLGFRLGIMELDNNGASTGGDGGAMVKHFNEKDETGWASLMSATRGRAPSSDAPIAEALYEGTGYFRQSTDYRFANNDWTNHGTGANCAATGNNFDPYCFQSARQRVPCAKSYVLLVSSGNYSNDNTTNIFGDAANAESWSNNWSLGWRSTGETSGQEGIKANGGWADNVAYKMHTTDLRPESTLPGNQSIGVYAVNTFGAGSGDGTEILKRIARYGGFIDTNGNGNYDSGEDDKNGNGVPDTYFQASGGGDLRAQIVNAVMDILKNSASGTSVSVLSTSAGGEGALYQAYFYPAKVLNDTEERRWPGYLRAFFIDRYQNLRDDHSNSAATGASSPDASLVLNEDRVVTMYLDPQDNSVRLDFQQDTNGDGIIKNVGSSTEETKVLTGVPMDNVASLWEGGAKLAGQDKSGRHIYLWLDRDGDGVIDGTGGGDFSSTDDASETIELSSSIASDLIPYFRSKDQIWDTTLGFTPATDTSKLKESENLINFVLGHHIQTNDSVAGNHQTFRNRCIYVNDPAGALSHESGCSGTNAPANTKARVWPLGDIVFSTPTLVAGPSERYDKIYSDAGYVAFRSLYQNRRNVVYVGANDGMLHAFNAGVYKQGDKSGTTDVEYGWFTAGPTSGDGWSRQLGEELWAFLPYDNLPHIPWLVCNGSTGDASACYNTEYTHVYYVDHRPKVTDVRIFNDSSTSVSGMVDGQTNVAHPHGWGTIMILPLRLGGGAINIDLNGDGDTSDAGETSFRSAYYIFDITDPEKPPRLLRRFTHANLGFTTSYPTVARIESGSTEKWFMVVGSGPENNPPGGSRAYGFASSTQDGKIFVVDLADGATTVLDADTTITGYQVMSDPTAIDVDLDFSVDVIYIGSTVTPSGTEEGATFGRIYRINTGGSTSPSSWAVSKFFDVDPASNKNGADPDLNEEMGPLVSGPSASKDVSGRLWVYFGTGQLRNRSDMSNSDQQRFYGIRDNCWKSTSETACTTTTYGKSNLMNTTDVTIYDVGGGRTANQAVQIPTAGTDSACGGSDTQCSWSTFLNRVRQNYQGWYLDLDNPASAPSEKVLSKSSILGGVALFTSYKPSGDLCSIFGDSTLNSVYYETGSAYPASVIGSRLVDANGTILTDASGNAYNGDDYVRNAAGELVRKDNGAAAPTGAEKVFMRETNLGQGMPTSVGLAVGETTTGFVQQSTGEIVKVRSEPIFKIKSGPTSWREQPTGGRSPGLEMIYRHISK